MMKMRLHAVLLAVLVSLCFVNSCVGNTGRELVVVFKGDQTEVPYEDENGKIIMRKPRAFRVPAFVGTVIDGKEFLAVLCDARYNGFSDWSFIEAAARTSYGDYKKWSNVEIFAKNTRVSETHSVMGDITAVMKGDKIYALASSWDESEIPWNSHRNNSGWNPLMIVGTVTNSGDSKTGGVSVKWDKGTSLKHLLPKTVLGAPGHQFLGGVGNGVVTKNGTIVFPLQVGNDRHRHAASIMYSTDDGSTWQIGGEAGAGASEGSVVEWGDGKLLLAVRHDGGLRKAYESEDMGETWKESTMFSRVWGNDPSRTGVGSQGSVITVPVDGEDVLLFAHPLNKKGRYSRDNLLLWVSDGQRIVCVGRISEDFKGKSSGYSILAHVGDNLYSVHEINPFGDWNNYDAKLKKWDRVIALSPLPQFFEKVKKTVRAWRELDAGLKTLGIPTDAIVGFLGKRNDEYVWEDMYNCVNARVNAAKPVPEGFRFNTKPGSGAQWPVRIQRQNQVYSFTEKHFTISATVTIHATTETGYFPLLGVSVDSRGKSLGFGIGYTHDNKWYAIGDIGMKIMSETSFEPEKEYHIALTFANKVGSVYVDGVEIKTGETLTYSSTAINHFYMGATAKYSKAKGSSCTVKNVMLFNKALSQDEITGLSKADRDDKLKTAMVTIDEKINAVAGVEWFSHGAAGGSACRGGLMDDEEDPDDTTMNAAVLSLSFVVCMCLVYPVIVLACL